MRKTVLLIAVLVMALHINAATTSNSADLIIKAYRVGNNKVPEIEIVDALPSNEGMESIGDNGTIDLTNYLKRYMGASGSGSDGSMSMFSEHVIFAYRVTGSTEGTYAIAIGFEPFSFDGTEPTENDHIINASYEIGSESYTFLATGSSSYGNNSIGETGNQIDSKITLEGASATGSFIKTFSVDASDPNAVPLWIVRGSVALFIDPTTYEAAEYGTYSSTVTVKLESVT